MALRMLASLGLAGLALAAPARDSSEALHKRYLEERNGITYNVFKRDNSNTALSYVENSGICVSLPSPSTFQSIMHDYCFIMVVSSCDQLMAVDVSRVSY